MNLSPVASSTIGLSDTLEVQIGFPEVADVSESVTTSASVTNTQTSRSLDIAISIRCTSNGDPLVSQRLTMMSTPSPSR